MAFVCSSGWSTACRRRPVSPTLWGEQLAMGEIDGVILLSARTAAVYAKLVRASAARDRPTLLHFCLSAAVARRLAPLGPGRADHGASAEVEESACSHRGDRGQNRGTSRGLLARRKSGAALPTVPAEHGCLSHVARGVSGAQEATEWATARTKPAQGASRPYARLDLKAPRWMASRAPAARQHASQCLTHSPQHKLFLRDQRRTVPLLTHLAAGLLGGALASLALLAFSGPREGEGALAREVAPLTGRRG
jgi:hypothetical protein